jgi:hypothetical protein
MVNLVVPLLTELEKPAAEEEDFLNEPGALEALLSPA